ncbi:hypothetical protein ACOME3_004419 [Neoechinorhynchus agilis]
MDSPNMAKNEPKMSREEQRQAEEQQKEEARNSILNQVLDKDAIARLNTLRLTKPENATTAERYIINQVQRGMIRSKLSEDDLVRILTQIFDQTSQSRQHKITFHRRRNDFDEDEDDFDGIE